MIVKDELPSSELLQATNLIEKQVKQQKKVIEEILNFQARKGSFKSFLTQSCVNIILHLI
jgi:hypothetical protein